jgi:hypothetical protein
MRSIFQWSDDEEGEASGYASTSTISSVQTHSVLVHMADNNSDLVRRLAAQEQAMKAQQETLDNIQRLLEQLMKEKLVEKPSGSGGGQNNESSHNSGGGDGHHEEEHIHIEFNEDEAPPEEENSLVNSDVIKGIQAQIASLTHREGLKKSGMTRPYPVEWDLVPYPPKFKPPTLQSYNGKGSPTQHIYYFQSQVGNVIDNNAIVTRLFIGTLKGIAFDWFRTLPAGSINSWTDIENKFLSRFYEDDVEITMGTLLETKQTEKESIKDFIERFRNLSLLCPPGMPLSMLLQTCRHNFLRRVERLMGSVKAHSWKELVEQAEIAEKSANREEPIVPKSKWNFSDKNKDRRQSSQPKGKETMVIETPKDTSPHPQKVNSGGSGSQ